MSARNKNVNKLILLASAGGAFEMYDFVIYIFFASILSRFLFPMKSTYIALVLTLAIFATGYLFRPIGGIIFGYIGDRYGRQKSLLLSLYLMAGSMLIVGLMPTYAQIGFLSPLLFFLFRLIQGIALGGNLPGAITFVNEHADKDNRGFVTGLLYCFVNVGILLAALIGVTFTNILSPHEIQVWGWRVAFIVGVLLLFIGFYFRNNNVETPFFQKVSESHSEVKSPFWYVIKNYPLNLCRAFVMAFMLSVVVVQLFLYMPLYLHQVIGVNAYSGEIINVVNIMFFSLCIPVFGFVSDILGRKIFFILATILFFILSYPLYVIIDAQNIEMMIALLCFGIMSSFVVGVIPVTLAEMFPTTVRYTAIGITYNLAFALVGGFSPLVITCLLHRYHNNAVLPGNLMFFSLILFIFIIVMPFKKNKPLE